MQTRINMPVTYTSNTFFPDLLVLNKLSQATLAYSQISMDVPYAPYVWGRNFDVASLCGILDFFVVMAYDMYGGTPSANCPIKNVLNGKLQE